MGYADWRVQGRCCSGAGVGGLVTDKLGTKCGSNLHAVAAGKPCRMVATCSWAGSRRRQKASAVCVAAGGTPSIPARLAGTSCTEGRVEVYANGFWGQVGQPYLELFTGVDTQLDRA